MLILCVSVCVCFCVFDGVMHVHPVVRFYFGVARLVYGGESAGDGRQVELLRELFVDNEGSLDGEQERWRGSLCFSPCLHR